jgi:hypothetical protein
MILISADLSGGAIEWLSVIEFGNENGMVGQDLFPLSPDGRACTNRRALRTVLF